MKNINKLNLVFAALLSTSLLSGCFIPLLNHENGSGTLKTTSLDIQDFTSLNVNHGFTVEIEKGDSFSISITTDDNLESYILAKKEGTVLNLGKNTALNINATKLKAVITMPQIHNITLSNSSKMTINGFVDINNLHLNLRNSSSITSQNGNADNVTITGANSSKINLIEFPIKEVDLTLSNSSRAEIHVSEKLGYSIRNSSKLRYQGSPLISPAESTGSSSVTKL